LVRYNLCDVSLHFAYEGPAALELYDNVNFVDLPVRRTLRGRHIMADITLPYGEVMHDYMDDSTAQPEEDAKQLTRSQILSRCAMPFFNPSYKLASTSLQNREYFTVRYRTRRDAIRRVVPDKLIPNEQDEVLLQFIKTAGTGLGAYSKCQLLVPCTDVEGNKVNFLVMIFTDSSSAVTFGREVLGQPHKYSHPSLNVEHDTIVGQLNYSPSFKVCTATMQYKHQPLAKEKAKEILETPDCTLKFIPDCQGRPEIAQLVYSEYRNVNVIHSYTGHARLDMRAHVNAPIADFPCLEVVEAYDMFCEMELAGGKVVHDYATEIKTLLQ
jgi:acetoacetate decarboxylase